MQRISTYRRPVGAKGRDTNCVDLVGTLLTCTLLHYSLRFAPALCGLTAGGWRRVRASSLSRRRRWLSPASRVARAVCHCTPAIHVVSKYGRRCAQTFCGHVIAAPWRGVGTLITALSCYIAAIYPISACSTLQHRARFSCLPKTQYQRPSFLALISAWGTPSRAALLASHKSLHIAPPPSLAPISHPSR